MSSETGFDATEKLQKQFPAEDFADPEDQAAIQQATEGLAPEQLGVALDGVLHALAGSGEVDCEALAVEMMTTPEKALEAVTAVLDGHSRMITRNLFDGDQDLHREFVQWAVKNERQAYVKASEAVARTQSSRPMVPLVQARIAAMKAEAAKTAKKATAPKAKASQQSEYDREVAEVRRRMAYEAERHREEQRQRAAWARDLD